MRMSRIAILGLISIVLVSVVITKIANIISVNYDFQSYSQSNNNEEDNDRPASARNRNLVIGASPSNLIWFLQISDIHISIFNDPERIHQFREFCDITVETIKPEVVLASGDLADAKTNDMIGSRQFLQEWQYYGEILQDTKIPSRTLWLDIRGNHDNFNVPGVNSTTSYFHQYSVQGKKHLRSYMYTIEKGDDKYSFIAVDACLEPGPRRPFNFIGTLTQEQYLELEKFEKESRASTATIWFGHYPTSCIISPKPGLRKLMRNGIAYMCGHLHTLGGTVPNMYTLQHNGFLELELGDWKDNRLYRLAAFDHGLFSFVDISHGQWPIILVTNPKAAEFGLPHKEPLSNIGNSTHIRLLAFSIAQIEIVQVKIDDGAWESCENVGGPLYVRKWEPKLFPTGLHTMKIKVRDKDGRETEVNHSFSLDGSRKKFRLLPRVTLMTDATSIFYNVFLVLVVGSVLPLLFIRILHILVRNNRVGKPEFANMWISPMIRKLWILSTVNKLFYPILLYPIYLTIGPWFIGEVIDNHVGAAFAWGTYVKGTILPGAFSYFYGCIQLFWFHVPFVIGVCHSVDYRFRTLYHPDLTSCSYITSAVGHHLPCLLVLLTQALFAYYFWLAYGTMALFLGPLRTWSVIMGAYLWYTAVTLQAHHLLDARIIWGNKDYYYFEGENKVESRHAL